MHRDCLPRVLALALEPRGASKQLDGGGGIHVTRPFASYFRSETTRIRDSIRHPLNNNRVQTFPI